MGCGGIQPKALGAYFQILRDDCQGPDSDGDIRVGGIVSQDDGETEYKLFSKPG